MKNKKRKIVAIVTALIVITLVITILVSIKPHESKARIALIMIEGLIVDDGLHFRQTSAQDILKAIEDTKSNDYDGILLYINSGGGSASSSLRIANAIKKYKEKTNKSVFAYADNALSGAYLVASAADKIYADKFSLIGSIGVTASYLEFAGLLERYNITYREFALGEYKEIGNPLKRLDEEERVILEKKLEKIYNIFVSEVAANRNKSFDEIKNLATGEFFLADEAVEHGLIDGVKSFDEVKEEIEQSLNKSVELVEIKRPKSLAESLKEILVHSFYAAGFGFGDILTRSSGQVLL